MQYPNLPDAYGKPGRPGSVVVEHPNNLYKGFTFPIYVGKPGKGGKGGPAGKGYTDEQKTAAIANKGGAGGGRENVVLIEPLRKYAEELQETDMPPLIFDEPGEHLVTWPYDTSTATVVIINPGGGGGGGAGNIVEGEEGEEGMKGITIIFPTALPLTRDRS